jgi:D-arabinose 1-dehydrogenase-like Zn-dependent alcohol dehydrogenase
MEGGVEMKAAVFRKAGRPFAIEDVPVPKVGPDEVLVEVKAAGICHTDVSIMVGAYGDWVQPGRIAGHEGAGIVVDVGAEVKGFRENDRVVMYNAVFCGECAFCRMGETNLCLNRGGWIGMDAQGVFAEYYKTPAHRVLHLPEEIPFEQGALLADCFQTPYHAVHDMAKVAVGENVAVFGCGGLGTGAVVSSLLHGGRTIAVDISEFKLEFAKKLGADELINANLADPVEKIKELTDGLGADVSLEVVGKKATMEQALAATRRGGRTVIVGFVAETLPLDTLALITEQRQIFGNCGGTMKTVNDLIGLVKAGKVDPGVVISHRFGLPEGVNEGLDLVQNGPEGVMRVVLVKE